MYIDLFGFSINRKFADGKRCKRIGYFKIYLCEISDVFFAENERSLLGFRWFREELLSIQLFGFEFNIHLKKHQTRAKP